MTKEQKRVRTLQNIGILVLILAALFLIKELFWDTIEHFFTAFNMVLIPASIALFISYLLAPIIKLIEDRKVIPKRWMTVLLVILSSLVVLGFFAYFIGGIIYDQAVLFFDQDWASILASVEEYILNNEQLSETYDTIKGYFDFTVVSPVLLNMMSIFKNAATIALIIVLVPVFLFFILNDKEKIFNGIITVVPKKYRKTLQELGVRTNTIIEKYFNGRFISMFIMSIFYTICFFILGFGARSVFFGFTLGFLDIIPYIGATIGVLLPLLYAFTLNDNLLFHQYAPIAVLVINFAGQGLQSIIQPFIMGKEVDMHPLLVLSSFIFFGALFGVVGVILAIPITGVIRTIAEYFAQKNEVIEVKS